MQDRLAHQTDQFLKGVLASALSGIEHGGQGGIGARPPLGPETAQHLAMNDRRPQISLTEIVGGLKVMAIQENKETVPILLIPSKQDACLRSFETTFQ